MLTKEDILYQINEIGVDSFTTKLQRLKFEQSMPIQEFSFKGYVTSIHEKNRNVKLELIDTGKIFNKHVDVIVTLLHPSEKNGADFYKFNINDEIKINCTFKKINIKIKKDYLLNDFYEINISVVDPLFIELLKTAKEIEEERKLQRIKYEEDWIRKKKEEDVKKKEDELKRKKNEEELRKIAAAKVELENAIWLRKILIIPGILSLLIIIWILTR
jgi:hypothetical protein